ncbi:MAG: hypothetical protein M3N13_03300 [Candidatus Eremiobacteraeota bacterium]|nr:hypothetical protein [Candidatus Eremiobacteraeota bacterium]
MQDYVEAVETLRDFTGWLLDDDDWKHVPLTPAQALALRDIHDKVMDFDDRLSERDSRAAITDPAWPTIMRSADSALRVLCEGSHALRPQVRLP